MSRKKRRFKGNLFFSEHHLTPKSEGGKGKDKKRVLHSKHVAWHTLVKDSLPKKAAEILSDWISPDCRFFSVNINNPHAAIMEINKWIESNHGNFKIKIKEKSKIIRLSPKYWAFARNSS